jgi:hypothetical protein
MEWNLMSLESLTVVRLLTDRFRDEGVPKGAIGVILDVYDDAYEVEFSRPDGTTIAWFAVDQDEVEPAVGSAIPQPGARTG